MHDERLARSVLPAAEVGSSPSVGGQSVCLPQGLKWADSQSPEEGVGGRDQCEEGCLGPCLIQVLETEAGVLNPCGCLPWVIQSEFSVKADFGDVESPLRQAWNHN